MLHSIYTKIRVEIYRILYNMFSTIFLTLTALASYHYLCNNSRGKKTYLEKYVNNCRTIPDPSEGQIHTFGTKLRIKRKKHTHLIGHLTDFAFVKGFKCLTVRRFIFKNVYISRKTISSYVSQLLLLLQTIGMILAYYHPPFQI